MEALTVSLIMNNKTIINPINKNEVFNCSDLYKEHQKCIHLNKYGKMKGFVCNELKQLARNCYFYTLEDFEKLLISNFHEKKKYINYLKKEDSILYYVYLNNPSTYTICNYDEDNQSLASSINENISS